MRPRWSVMLPAYNPNAWLREALESVIAARDVCGETMQIEVVDDASPEVDVAALIASWGFADVSVFRRPSNGGLGKCWNTCIERANGELLHLLHQDDRVEPAFYARISDAADTFASAGMLFCRSAFEEGAARRVDALEQPDAGVLSSWLERIGAGQRLQCPSAVVRRGVYATVGGFDPALRYVIDWEMWVRIAARFDVAYVPEPLAIYRVHEGAETARLKTAGLIGTDLVLGIGKIARTLRSARTNRRVVFAARAHAWSVLGHLANEAQRSRHFRLAAAELGRSLRHFGRGRSIADVWGRVRWYLSLRVRGVRAMTGLRHAAR